MSGVPLRPTFLLLALAIVAASALGLWWLLRRESRTTLLVLAVLTSLALAVRLAYTTDFPPGLNEDEPKVLYAAGLALQRGTLLAESNISVPVLMHALFQGQLIPLLGPGRWAIRAYSLVGGVLCVPAGFAAARALPLAVAPSLAVGGLIAVLPWALFYSRVMQGAELTFQQLLLIAALARLVFTAPAGDTANGPRSAGWREWALGSFALGWLLYGYWCTRAMVGMPLIAAALASGRRRWWCLAILPVALLAYAPYVVANRQSMFIAQGVSPAYYAGFGELARLAQRAGEALGVFVWPRAEDGWLTIRAAALHPPFLLIVAAFGALSGVRRAVFLGGGFLAGLAPTILAWGAQSTHRMLMAFPFVALASGCALDDLIPRRGLQRAASAALVIAIAAYSIPLYFSAEFWPFDSRSKFDGPRTELVESLPLPPSPPVILMRQVLYFRYPRYLVAPGDQDLDADNWWPEARGAIYAFSADAVALRPFYEDLLGPRRVESFGWTFKVTFEPGDWSWLRQHGWSYETHCGDSRLRGQVPVLFQPGFSFAGLICSAPVEHTWRARWNGPSTALRLHTNGPTTVDAGGVHLESGAEAAPTIDFTAEPGMDLRVTVTLPRFQPFADVALFEHTPIGERVPMWERTVPIVSDPPA